MGRLVNSAADNGCFGTASNYIILKCSLLNAGLPNSTIDISSIEDVYRWLITYIWESWGPSFQEISRRNGVPPIIVHMREQNQSQLLWYYHLAYSTTLCNVLSAECRNNHDFKLCRPCFHTIHPSPRLSSPTFLRSGAFCVL